MWSISSRRQKVTSRHGNIFQGCHSGIGPTKTGLAACERNAILHYTKWPNLGFPHGWSAPIVTGFARNRMTQVQKLLRELIALPSVNNSLLPPGHPRAGERRVVEFLTECAGRAGLDARTQRVLPGRSNLLVRLTPPGKPRRRVVLAPHLDTVDIASPEQLVPRMSKGRLYGRGACDTKGSVAAMFTALCDIAHSRRRP